MQALFFIFCHLHKLCKRHFLHFAICIGYASIKTFVFTFAERRCVFGIVGAVPVCPPERPRSGVSIRKYIYASRIMHEDLTMDAPLTGRHGRAHRHRPYPSPSYTFLHHSIKRHHPSTCNPPMIDAHFGCVPAKPFII